MSENILDVVGKAACLEQRKMEQKKHDMSLQNRSMNGQLNPLIPMHPYGSKFIIKLDNKIVTRTDLFTYNPKLRSTAGFYTIKYFSKGSRRYRKGRPYQIGQDLIHWDIRVTGYKYWDLISEKVPELKWLKENSTLTGRLFAIAKMHPGMSIFFTIDWDKYVSNLEAQAAEIGLNFKQDDNLPPLTMYRMSIQEAKKYNDMVIPDSRYMNEILEEINETENSAEVKKEMAEECGEVYNRSREFNNQPRDSHTGMFVSKKKVI